MAALFGMKQVLKEKKKNFLRAQSAALLHCRKLSHIEGNTKASVLFADDIDSANERVAKLQETFNKWK